MLDCRYYDLCCLTDDSCNGEPECPNRDHCQFYSPMPDVRALTGLADEMQGYADGAASVDGFPYVNAGFLWSYARRIREALGVTDG